MRTKKAAVFPYAVKQRGAHSRAVFGKGCRLLYVVTVNHLG